MLDTDHKVLEQKKRLLLYRLRKEMNGAALDTMRYYGADYERNYGVQIYAIRALAKEIGTDSELSRYFYKDSIREVRLVGVWIAEAESVTPSDFAFWREGIINSEVSEQLSHALLCRVSCLKELLEEWSKDDNSLVVYAALLAASRNGNVEDEVVVGAILNAVNRFEDNRLVAQGATALAMHIDDAGVAQLISRLPENPTANLLREEIAWRVE